MPAIRIRAAFFLLLAVMSGGVLAGDIYAYLAPDGTYHFADEKRDARYTLYLRDEVTMPANPKSQIRSTTVNVQPFIERAAAREGIDPALVQAIISVESNYNPSALSPTGALGLMQLMPATAGRYGVTDRADPEQNISGGTRYLRRLIERFGRIDLALAAYNAGEEAVERHKRRIPPFAETRAYVPRVLERYRNLRKEAL
jgi:soluble lytic murein transglycosylase